MKKVFTAITLSLSAMMATSAMAGSYERDYHGTHSSHPSQWNQQNKHWDSNHRYDRDHDRYSKYDTKRVNPSREWRSGQYFPNSFNSSRYAVNYKNHRHLSKPGKYQQWYKVNGDYVLVNERSNRIIRIIG